MLALKRIQTVGRKNSSLLFIHCHSDVVRCSGEVNIIALLPFNISTDFTSLLDVSSFV